MIISLKTTLRKIFPPGLRLWVKKTKRHCKQLILRTPYQSIEDIEQILRQLGIHQGDRLIVASSYGNLKADYAPIDLVRLLQRMVGEQGIIMMPYYPPMNSTEWAQKGLVFDMNATKSGMGVLTNVFAKMPGVLMSKHPTKAICVWGNGAEEIVKDHEKSTTPFYWDSPYGKILRLGCKSLGLGLKNIPIFHTFEDVLSQSPDAYYQKEKYQLHLIDKQGVDDVVETYVHDPAIIDRCKPAGDYVRDLKCKSYKRIDVGSAFVYIIDNTDLFDRCKVEFAHGNSRLGS